MTNLPDTQSDNLPAPVDPAVRPAADISPEEARELTTKIVEGRDNIVLLLAEAQVKKAWSALGYASWKHYIASEFEMSEANSYRLIDQARVSRAIEQGLVAAQPALGPDSRAREPQGLLVTGRGAQALTGDLDGAVKEITESVAAGATPADAVKDAVNKRRRAKPTPTEVAPDPDGLDTLGEQPPAPPGPKPPSPHTPPVPPIQTAPAGRTCPTCKGAGVIPVTQPGGTNARDRRDAEAVDPKECRHPTPIDNYCPRCQTTLKRGR